MSSPHRASLPNVGVLEGQKKSHPDEKEATELMTVKPDYSRTAEAQDTDLKTNFMKMIAVPKEEVRKSLKRKKANKRNGGNQ